MSDQKTYTICGSTRFEDAMTIANQHLTGMGHFVFTVGMFGHTNYPDGSQFLIGPEGDTAVKRRVDRLHLDKISRSDAIFVVNVCGYVGNSTRNEIVWAADLGLDIEFMFPDAVDQDLQDLIDHNRDLGQKKRDSSSADAGSI